MNKFQIPILIALVVAIVLALALPQHHIPVVTPPGPVHYVGKVEFNASPIAVRLLVLKHCFEQMADGDANMAIEAVNLAAGKGLSIKEIGNFHINREGQAQRRLVFYNADGLKTFVSSQMKVSAQSGDTLVIMTIGHGSNTGYLQSLGQRQDILRVLAEAAAENQQETLWWQLSCYASNRLDITKCTPQQLEHFSIVASSDANTQSPAYVEGKIMEKVFIAMANKDSKLDSNQDDAIVAKELAVFLESVDRGRGQLVYARSPDERLFGPGGIARKIPIVDHNNPQGKYPEDYVPFPQDKIPIPKFWDENSK